MCGFFGQFSWGDFAGNFSARCRRRPHRVRHDVHSAPASWVSYVARPGTLLRPLEVFAREVFDSSVFDPSVFAFIFFLLILLQRAPVFLFLWPLTCGK